jgi:predicted branched-subunit amino acid permease
MSGTKRFFLLIFRLYKKQIIMTKINTGKSKTFQIFEDKITFKDNAKFLWNLRLAAVVCWFSFSIINTFRFLNDPSLMYIGMTLMAVFVGVILGYPLIKEITSPILSISEISQVLIKSLPAKKIQVRLITERKKFRQFTITINELEESDLINFFHIKKIPVHKG